MSRKKGCPKKQKGPGRPKKAKSAFIRKREEDSHNREAVGHERYTMLKTQKMATYRVKIRESNKSAGETSCPKSANERKQEQRMRDRQNIGTEKYNEMRAAEKAEHKRRTRKAKQDAPIATYAGDDLDKIVPISLEYVSLNNAEPCAFCGARLFKEEKSRSKWCCSEGKLFFPKPPPLTAPFYDEVEFLHDVRQYNNMFAFSALGVTGNFQKAPNGYGPQMVKIQGKTYHRIFDLNWNQPGCPNNSQLYIDDGLMRQNLAKERKLNSSIVSEIEEYLQRENSLCGVYQQLGSHPAEDAHIVFEKTTRAKRGPVLGDRPLSYEISGIIRTSNDPTSQPSRKVTVWKNNAREPQFIHILDPVYEPLQYPILFPDASSGWHVKMTSEKGEKLSMTKYYRQWLLCEDERVRKLGRLGQEYCD